MDCPFLESLDLTKRPEDPYGTISSAWCEIGEALSQHGASLRKFRYDNTPHPSAPGLLNVSSLCNLRNLAVPVDALVAFHEYHKFLDDGYCESHTFRGNCHGYGSVHDIEGMWHETLVDKKDTARRNGSETAGMGDEEEDIARSVLAERHNVLFSYLLPDALHHLRILDDVDTECMASCTDQRLRELVLDPRFSELRDLQVRRRKVFTEHVRDIGRRIERRPFWAIM
jgi:hypothetical protein